MRSIYTIIQHVCVSDFIDYSFWGFVVGLVTLAGGTGLAVYLYLKTKKNTDDLAGKFTDKIESKSTSSDILITD